MKTINVTQQSPEWHELRKTKIGASDAAVILGISPWKTPYELWLEKKGKWEISINPHMQRGMDMEEEARKAFEEFKGVFVSPRVIIHEEHEFMMASLDGIDMLEQIAVEIKCPNETVHEMAKNTEIPPYYYAQIQHQLAVSGLDYMYYYTYRNPEGFTVGEGVPVLVNRNEDYIENLIALEKEFYEMMINDTPPELTNKDTVERDDDEWKQKSLEFLSIREKIEELKKQEEALKEELIKLSDGQSCKGYGVQLTRSIRKGSIPYSSLKEIQEMDLEKYRKPSNTIYTLKTYGS